MTPAAHKTVRAATWNQVIEGHTPVREDDRPRGAIDAGHLL
jgi:hypothetical protein